MWNDLNARDIVTSIFFVYLANIKIDGLDVFDTYPTLEEFDTWLKATTDGYFNYSQSTQF